MLEMIDQDKEGMVLRIERSSIHDGDGLRTVVFLKGCPLRCQWCSTPESQAFGIEQAGEHIYGQSMTVAQVMQEVRKDSIFFFLSSGGVTLSGGEVLAQPDFTRTLLHNCKREGFNTAIETSFFGQWEHIERMLPYINTIYADLKFVDRDLHKQYCGVDNQTILNNLIATSHAEGKFRLVIRTPIIPGVNDSEEELERIGIFCTGLNRLDHVQLLPYHRLGTETYKRLKRPYLLQHISVPSEEQMERCRNIVRRYVEKTI